MDKEKHNYGMQDGLDLDMLIIGAGVSGLYTGWRLLSGEYKEGPKSARAGAAPRVHVLEASHRIGGRLETLFLEGMPHVRGEFGGMRYLSSHLLVANLVNFLGLRNTFFPMGDGNNLFYLRGKRYRSSELAAATKDKNFPYRMAKGERGVSPYTLFNQVFQNVLAAGGMQPPNTAEQWNELKTNLMYKGKHIYDVGFWNMMLDELSNEGFNYVADAGGYYSNIVNGGAGEGMEEIMGDFSSNPTYLTLEHGYDQIPIGLAKQFKRYGGEIWSRNRLLKLERGRNGKIKAHIENWTHKKWTITARHVVLGMPRRSLELLDPTSFIFESGQLAQDVATVIKEPAHKLFMGYESPWWRKAPLNLQSGEAVTDLPIRQTYYFGTECEQAGGEKGNTNSLLMAGYNDMWSMYFWKGLELKDQQSNDLEGDPTKRKRYLKALEQDEGSHNPYRMRPYRAMKKKPLSAPGEGPGIDVYMASEAMVHYAQMQLREIHGVRIPDPYIAAFRDWSQDPFGAGYHAWATNVNVEEVMKRMRKPLKDANVYICGEAYSDNQGWVEGALTTTEKMVQDHLGLKWPKDWLPEDYYLGW